ncbi:hypothetical protein CLOSTHATH_07361, partial [Hungatella hathewayi DSM 13479]
QPGLGSVYADRGKTGAGRERLPPDHRMGSAYGDHAPKKFAKDVKASSLEFFNNEDDNIITIPNASSSDKFEEGQIYVLHNEASSEGDIAVKVIDVKETTNGKQVYYEEPELEEVIDSLHISGTETSESEFIPAEGVTVTQAGRMLRSSGTVKFNCFNGLNLKATVGPVSYS